MKRKDLEKSSKCDIIFGTYQLVSEGTDIPTLNTLVMASPRKEIEQVVGRILRGYSTKTPIVVDIIDDDSEGKIHELLVLNVGTATTWGRVNQIGNTTIINLKRAIAVNVGSKVAISRKFGSRWHLIGWGEVK